MLLVVITSMSIGISVALEDMFIIDSETARNWEFPHTAFLSTSYSQNPSFKSLCGATIISNRVLVTAAHCLQICSPDCAIVVSVGDGKRSQGFNYTVDTFIIHSKYSRRTLVNDIALVRLKEVIKFSQKVKKAVLAKATPFGENAQVVGWGRIDEQKNISKVLKFSHQLIRSRKDCAKLLNSIMPEGTICSSEVNNKDYTARGDSGGGLMVEEYIQVGIVSYKNPSVSKAVSVYTEIAYFYKWIIKNLFSLHCLKKLQ